MALLENNTQVVEHHPSSSRNTINMHDPLILNMHEMTH